MAVQNVTEGFENAREHERNTRYLVTSRGDKATSEFSPLSGLTAGSAQRAAAGISLLSLWHALGDDGPDDRRIQRFVVVKSDRRVKLGTGLDLRRAMGGAGRPVAC